MKRAYTLDILQKSVEKLSLPSGEDEYILQHEMPLPSIEKLKEVVDLLRSVIFYGYYGEPCVAFIPFVVRADFIWELF